LEQIQEAERLGAPVMLLGGAMHNEELWITQADDFTDSREATRRLIEMGHQGIGFVAETTSSRFRGYAQALGDAGIPLRMEYVMTCREPEEYAAQLLDLEVRPTAIFITRHLERVKRLLDGLRSGGVQPGRDVYLCSYYDEFWNNIAPLGIPYARVEHPVEAMAKSAVRILMDRIEGKSREPLHTVLRSRFVVVPGAEVSAS